MAALQHTIEPRLTGEHKEPKKPEVYEPPDLFGRKHVEKVTTEYRVREDECLADKLQNEEFELHFGKNKNERLRGHVDIKTAKEIYLKEVAESGLLSSAELRRLTKDDSFIAHEIDRRVQEEKEMESQRLAAVKMQDEEFARYLEAKEREKVEVERKKRLERRIAQDRESAERLQLEFEEEGSAQKGVSRSSVKRNRPPTTQRGGWDIDLEVGASAGARTKEELHVLKDAEIARSIQLQETEEEQRRIELERDRKIAMKLQRLEAEEYKREKEERRRRREERESIRRQQEQRADEDAQLSVEVTTQNTRKKILHSVDATGKPVTSSNINATSEIFRHQNSVERQRTGSSNSTERYRGDNTPERKISGKSSTDEAVYLQAVDATGNQQRSSSHRVSSRKGAENRDKNLVDDQRALQEQMRRVELIGKQDKSKASRNSKKNIKNSTHVYDTPENDPNYNNILTNLDPTYSKIDSLPRQQNGHDQQGHFAIQPIPIIQNVKREPDEGKKKKNWFSKKEKSK